MITDMHWTIKLLLGVWLCGVLIVGGVIYMEQTQPGGAGLGGLGLLLLLSLAFWGALFIAGITFLFRQFKKAHALKKSGGSYLQQTKQNIEQTSRWKIYLIVFIIAWFVLPIVINFFSSPTNYGW